GKTLRPPLPFRPRAPPVSHHPMPRGEHHKAVGPSTSRALPADMSGQFQKASPPGNVEDDIDGQIFDRELHQKKCPTDKRTTPPQRYRPYFPKPGPAPGPQPFQIQSQGDPSGKQSRSGAVWKLIGKAKAIYL